MKTWIIAAVCSLSLTGCAGLLIAGAATTANIITDTRSTQEIWQDSQLEFEVAGIGNKTPFSGNVKATATAFRGKVILIGQAISEDYKQKFGSYLADTDGVVSVSNQLRVRPLLDIQTVTKDTWITSKVKASLFADEKLSTIKIKVITEDGEVFLLGYVTPEQADIATDITRNVSGVKQVIRAFELSK
jgi:osmotically-inducible protein OsmY